MSGRSKASVIFYPFFEEGAALVWGIAM